MASYFQKLGTSFGPRARKPRHPTPKQWEALRKVWPILDGVPDDELMKNLVECRKEFCDVRFI